MKNKPLFNGIFNLEDRDFSWQIFDQNCSVIINKDGTTFTSPYFVSNLKFENNEFRDDLDWMRKDDAKYRTESNPGEFVIYYDNQLFCRVWAEVN